MRIYGHHSGTESCRSRVSPVADNILSYRFVKIVGETISGYATSEADLSTDIIGVATPNKVVLGDMQHIDVVTESVGLFVEYDPTYTPVVGDWVSPSANGLAVASSAAGIGYQVLSIQTVSAQRNGAYPCADNVVLNVVEIYKKLD